MEEAAWRNESKGDEGGDEGDESVCDESVCDASVCDESVVSICNESDESDGDDVGGTQATPGAVAAAAFGAGFVGWSHPDPSFYSMFPPALLAKWAYDEGAYLQQVVGVPLTPRGVLENVERVSRTAMVPPDARRAFAAAIFEKVYGVEPYRHARCVDALVGRSVDVRYVMDDGSLESFRGTVRSVCPLEGLSVAFEGDDPSAFFVTDDDEWVVAS